MIEYQHCTYCSKCEMRLDLCECAKEVEMPERFNDDIEVEFQAILKRIKANNPDFDRNVERGKLMMEKTADELTDSERAFLDGDASKMN